MGIELVLPHKKYESSLREALLEFRLENSSSIPWYYDIQGSFSEYVNELLNRVNVKTDRMVPETVYWAVKGDDFIGRISIRHELNENLKRSGGHIGYEVRPSYRKQGTATEMLRLSLPLAKELKLSKVLLTCDDDNIPSIKTIEKNDGILSEVKPIENGKPLKRYYWIKL